MAISIDAGPPLSAAADAQEKLHMATSALYSLLGEHGLPATWGFAEPFTSALVHELRAGRRGLLPHEIALRLDGLGRSPHPRRTVLAHALSRHLTQAQICGVQITTLFADMSWLSGNQDLLVKRGITAVREAPADRGRARSLATLPRQVRWGLWQFPVAHKLTEDGPLSGKQLRFLNGRSNFGPGRQGQVLHVSIDVTRLTAGDRSAWRVLEKGVRQLARLRTDGGVRVESLRGLSDRLSTVPAAAPQRSILRRAA